MSYAVVVATVAEAAPVVAAVAPGRAATAARVQRVRDSVTGEVADWAIHDRHSLSPGAVVAGPAIIAEDETSTLVGAGWTASVTAQGYIELVRGTR
jgi:N-methylhydantoinase A